MSSGPSAPPFATYRLQFRCGMTFERAASLAPYLRDLGLSHLYASPIFQAAPGSTHGYDVIDHNVIEPEIGGEEGFAALSNALAAHGLKLLLDFVPNHMSASPHNPWWHDVLEWGERSRFAEHFDIDWSAPRLIIPALATNYGRALSDGVFSLAVEAGGGGLLFRFGNIGLPLSPPSYAQILALVASEDAEGLARRFAASTPEEAPELKVELAERLRDVGWKRALEKALADLEKDPSALHDLHEAQVWRLAHWRAARETMTYRRFFEISDLVGVRVERPAVFDAVHARLLNLVREGHVHAIRIDHVDGLADPSRYLQRLREEVGEAVPVYVEKILGPDENLRSAWQSAGTTGYEFIAAMAGLFVDPTGEAALSDAYSEFLGAPVDYASDVVAAKRRILTRNLAGELDYLAGQLAQIAATSLETRDLGRDTLRRAIIELAAAIPVYRSYVSIEGAHPEDQTLIDAAVTTAKATREVEDEGALEFLGQVLTLKLAGPAEQAAALDFVTRFQQTTSALAAKSVEDTVFYTYTRLMALNEVGGEPRHFGSGIAAFHQTMQRRREEQPLGLSATATHDTKRGEDARARLYGLSQMPEGWSRIVRLWDEAMAPRYGEVAGVRAPEPSIAWMIYQAVAGHWPADLQPDDRAGLEAFRERLLAFVRKAVREAKARTSWVAPDETYEAVVENFAAACIDPAQAPLEAILKELETLFLAGALTSASQTLLKLFAPGVPDIYQGTEQQDLSFVDPDNRRACLPPEANEGRDDIFSLKTWILRQCLPLRGRFAGLLAGDDYEPLDAVGDRSPNVVAFARSLGEETIIAVAPRLCLELAPARHAPFVDPEIWADTAIRLPHRLHGQRLRDHLSGQDFALEETMKLQGLFSRSPFAVLGP